MSRKAKYPIVTAPSPEFSERLDTANKAKWNWTIEDLQFIQEGGRRFYAVFKASLHRRGARSKFQPDVHLGPAVTLSAIEDRLVEFLTAG